jgi:predicted nucleic acid-binding protein
VILVDSDVLTEHLRGQTAARDWLVSARQSSGPLAISVVSLTEIAGGMRPPERREVMRLLGSMQPFEVTEQVAWPAATLIQQYRRSHSGIGLGEYLIASSRDLDEHACRIPAKACRETRSDRDRQQRTACDQDADSERLRTGCPAGGCRTTGRPCPVPESLMAPVGTGSCPRRSAVCDHVRRWRRDERLVRQHC